MRCDSMDQSKKKKKKKKKKGKERKSRVVCLRPRSQAKDELAFSRCQALERRLCMYVPES